MTTTPIQTATLAPERLHGLDALRGGALLLGVVLHATMAYLPAPIWIATDAQTSPVAGGIFYAIHLFRMPAFFLIAGLFGHMMLVRRGWWSFTKDRMNRIGGGLFGLWWVVFPAIVAIIVWKAAIDNGGVLPTNAPPPPPMTFSTFPLTHLWFLWVLLIFYAVMLAVRAVLSLDKSGVVGRFADKAAGLLIGPWSPALLAAPLALALSSHADWYPIFGIPTPDHGIVPNTAALIGFGVAFTIGVLLDRRRDLLNRIEVSWLPMTALTIGAGTAAYLLSGGPEISLVPVTGSVKAVLAWTYALAVYAGTFAAVGIALKFASGHSGLRRYLADSSYWVYILHLPVVMALQVLLLSQPWPWFAKLAAAAAGTLAICLVTYELLVRHTFIGWWLNGKRIPWRKPAPAAVPAE